MCPDTLRPQHPWLDCVGEAAREGSWAGGVQGPQAGAMGAREGSGMRGTRSEFHF